MKTVILAGGGTANLEIIKSLSPEEISAHRFYLVSPERTAYYSGLIPRFIAGDIAAAELTIDAAGFATSKGISFIQDCVMTVSLENRQIEFKSGRKMLYDFAVFNLGGVVPKFPNESTNETVYIRPFGKFLANWDRLERLFRLSTQQLPLQRFIVLGGGPAAVDVAAGLTVRLQRAGRSEDEVHLVTKDSRLCMAYSPSISNRIKESLEGQKLKIHFNELITEIQNHRVELKSGGGLNFDFLLIATPTVPSEIIANRPDRYLQVAPGVFVAGDGARSSADNQTPRSGVIAVRQGRHLADSLRRLLAGRTLRCFHPPERTLNILISGRETARLVWGDLTVQGRIPFATKDWIDRRYIKSFAEPID